MKTNNKVKVALVDDHVLLRNGLAGLVNSLDNYTVIFEADNGIDFQKKIKGENIPEMDGFATSQWLKQTYPLTKVLALSMYDNENSVIRMFKAGAKGYILKDSEPSEL